MIHRHQIEKLFEQRVYERGLAYYQNNRVHGLSLNKNDETWFAEVEGTEDYYVEINLSELSNGKIISYCECPAFDTYHSCKHLVAVLLAMADQPVTREGTEQMTSDFMEGIMAGSYQGVDVLSTKTPMKVEYYLHIEAEGKVWLECKTGVNHCYIVRNIREFLDNILVDRGHFFTKKFSYDPEQHYFLQQDRQIFELLTHFITTGDLFTDRNFYGGLSYDKRSLLIPPLAFKQLITELSERNIVVVTKEKDFHGIEIEEQSIPHHFAVTEDPQQILRLQLNGAHESYYLQTYKAIFSKGILFFPSDEQLLILDQVKQLGIRNQQLPISIENADRFFSEVLPVLKKSTDVKIADELTHEIVEYPLSAKLYLDNDIEMITGQLMYHYGPYEMDPFNRERESSSTIIIRDVEKEQKIMHLIEQSNFHYNGKELYIDMHEDEEVYDFLYNVLPLLDEYVELFLTAGVQQLIVDTEPVPSANVDLKSDSSLLEIGFDISGVNDEEVHEILQAVIEKKRYYRLHSGALISLEREPFQKVKELFQDLDIGKEDMRDGSVQVPVYRGLQVDEAIESKKYDPAFRKLLHRLTYPEEQVFDVPSSLQAELRPYQHVGFQWFKSLGTYHLGGILADDMGLGKTVQTIAYLLSESSEQPHLIIVPSSVMYNWRNEIRRFAPTLHAIVVSGSPQERAKKLEQVKANDILITSYGTIRQDIDLYETIQFQNLILDEAQFIKNYQTKTSKAVRQIHASYRFGLSGTPIENSVDELWAIFQVILPGLLPKLKDFRLMEPKKIAAITRPFILRRLKEDVLTDLPEKIETVHTSELTKQQKELYVGYLRELQEMTSQSIQENHFQQNRMKILAGLTRLRQLCCHPALFIENYEGRSGKLDELMEQVQTMLHSGKRLLIFSQFTSMHQIIIKQLEKLELDYFYLHGHTKAQDRVQMTEAFNNGERNIFLISLKAGGTGLNLTGADTVILFDLWWNPAVEDQAAGRAHRFGQKKVVQVIRFITEGTIEERMYELQQKKRELIDQVVQPGETMLSSLTEQDVKELLRI